MALDVTAYNRSAWDRQVAASNPWTIPVTAEQVQAARAGRWDIFLTPTRPVPRDWFPPLAGAEVLCLASGGGQQGPLLAAVGAHVTVLDNSPRQLAQDEMVAAREGLTLRTLLGDMADLSALATESFDLIVHPVSNTFVPDVRPVWAEAYRVLRPGGVLLAGFDNPVIHIFDDERYWQGELVVRYRLPYSDLESLAPEDLARRLAQGEPLEFGHRLEDQIGGQLAAGFVLTGLYEDTDRPEANDLLSRYLPPYIATRALKPLAVSHEQETGS